MKKLLVLAAFLALLGFANCSAPLEPGTPVETVATIESNAANNGKRFSVEGYICTPDSLYDGENEILPVTIWTEPAGEGELICTLQMRHYVTKNSFYVTDTSYTDEDMRFIDNENVQHEYDELARFSFTAKQAPDGTWTYTDVRIDAVE